MLTDSIYVSIKFHIDYCGPKLSKYTTCHAKLKSKRLETEPDPSSTWLLFFRSEPNSSPIQLIWGEALNLCYPFMQLVPWLQHVCWAWLQSIWLWKGFTISNLENNLYMYFIPMVTDVHELHPGSNCCCPLTWSSQNRPGSNFKFLYEYVCRVPSISMVWVRYSCFNRVHSQSIMAMVH